MTLTIDLTPEQQEQLAVAARQAGMAPEDFLKTLVSRLPLLPEAQMASGQKSTAAHAAVVRAMQGSLAAVGATVEDLHTQRQADKAREQASPRKS